MSTLQDQIEARKIEAVRKQIVSKAQVIARGLGKQIETWPSLESRWFELSGGDLRVYDHHTYIYSGGKTYYESKIEIEYRYERVFLQVDDRIHCFIPGTWEEEFERLYVSAVPALEQRRQEEKATREQARLNDEQRERQRWGL